ncbi:MAG: hypothetical protein ABH832_02070 [bacterium]
MMFKNTGIFLLVLASAIYSVFGWLMHGSFGNTAFMTKIGRFACGFWFGWGLAFGVLALYYKIKLERQPSENTGGFDE